jgi:hypothetical protein
VRVAGTIPSIAALFCGLVQAPFLHIHVKDRGHPATTPAHLHAHVSQKATGPTIGAHTADEDAIDVEWCIAQPVAFTLDLAIAEAVVIEPPLVVSASVSSLRPRGHDPPDLTPKQPRSPPA